MIRLRLRDLRDGHEYEFTNGPVTLGRSPDCDLVIGGSGRELVSGTHAKLTLQGDVWMVEDAGGRNGTFLDGRRVRAGAGLPLEHGQTLGLAELGPKFAVELDRGTDAPSIAGPDEATLPLSAYEPPAPEPGPAASVAVSLARVPTGDRLEATGPLLKIGRGEECDIRLAGEKIVSRVHCEIAVGAEGTAVLRDAQSRNGTRLDGEQITGDVTLGVGQRIQLGPQGPELLVTELAVTSPREAPPAPSHAAPAVPSHAAPSAPTRQPSPPAPSRAAVLSHQPPPAAPPPPAPQPEPAAREPRRSFGGVGRTVFVRQILQETEQKHASRLRGLVWTFVAVLVVGVGGVLWYTQRRTHATEAELAAQREALNAARVATDSARAAGLADYQALELQLQQAREGSAPAAVVDSLRAALEDARTHTASLEAALNRARAEMDKQLSAGDSLRRATQQETERLRQALASSRAGGVSSASRVSGRCAERTSRRSPRTIRPPWAWSRRSSARTSMTAPASSLPSRGTS
jgi:pSer/pThr/pTyr-binding forkhead associated (FHA) protein